MSVRWTLPENGADEFNGHDRKVTPDKKLNCSSYQGYKDENRDYYNHFLVIFQTYCKFFIVFIRFILGKVRIDGFSGPRRQIDIKFEFGFKSNTKGFRVQIEILAAIFDSISNHQLNLSLFLFD